MRKENPFEVSVDDPVDADFSDVHVKSFQDDLSDDGNIVNMRPSMQRQTVLFDADANDSDESIHRANGDMT